VQTTINSKQGFTLIEIIAVLLILSVMTAVAISNMGSSTDAVKLQAEADMIKSHLRYAQSRAMNSDSNWGIRFVTTKTYQLFKGTSATLKTLPGENSTTVTLSTLQVTPATVTFNNLGSPDTTTVSTTPGAYTITLNANTGFIP